MAEGENTPHGGKCSSLTKAGSPCRMGLWNATGLCIGHAAAAGDLEAKAMLAARGRSGVAQMQANRARRQPGESKMRTVEDLQTLVERETLHVRRSGADATSRANTVAKLVSLAMELLKVGELARENAELKALLLERHPELRKHLRAAI